VKVNELLELNNFKLSKNFIRLFKSLDKDILIKFENNKAYTFDEKNILIYSNPFEINFEGIYKFKRNSLINADENLNIKLDDYFLNSFKKNYIFDIKNKVELLKYCFNNDIKINFLEISNTLNEALKIYKSGSLYLNDSYANFEFKNANSSFILITKLL
jgi:hypothetical protein